MACSWGVAGTCCCREGVRVGIQRHMLVGEDVICWCMWNVLAARVQQNVPYTKANTFVFYRNHANRKYFEYESS